MIPRSVVTADPAVEPVSVKDVKQRLKYMDDSYNDDDNEILGHIKEARDWVENKLERSLITQTRRAESNDET